MTPTSSSDACRRAVLDPHDAVDRLIAFLAQFVALDETARQLIGKLTRIETYPKGIILLAAGETVRESWLVIQGCVRAFQRAHGRDQTVAFHTEFHPVMFESVCRVMGEALVATLQREQIELVTLPAEQRYLDLIARRPDLLQRVPQYHVASFLGIQPETLSRIRRRLIRRR